MQCDIYNSYKMSIGEILFNQLFYQNTQNHNALVIKNSPDNNNIKDKYFKYEFLLDYPKFNFNNYAKKFSYYFN